MFQYPINSEKDIEDLIEEIKTKIPDFTFSKENLIKFKEGNSEDIEFLSYLNGVGGSYVKFLSILMRKLQPQLTVELGNREGVSTLGMAESAISFGGKFITVDIVHDLRYFPDSLNDEKKNIFTIFGDVFDLNTYKEIPLDIDLLFSDTIHYNDQIRDEFEIYQYLLSDIALVAIDDIHVNDKGIFFDQIDYPKWDLTQLCHHSGWGLFLFQRREPLTREQRVEKALRASISVYQRRYQHFVDMQEFTTQNSISFRAMKSLRKTTLYRLLLPSYVHIYKVLTGKK